MLELRSKLSHLGRRVGDIPYCLVFGQLPYVGISALPLDASVLTQLATEAQLNRVCDHVGKVDVLYNDTAVVEAIDGAEEAETADYDKIQANTKNSKNKEYVAAVDNYDISGSGAADDNLDEITVELLQMMDAEGMVHKEVTLMKRIFHLQRWWRMTNPAIPKS